MARYSQSELHQMRSEAMRRARDLQQSARDYSFLPLREEPGVQEPSRAEKPKQAPGHTSSGNRAGGGRSGPSPLPLPGSFSPKELLDHLDSDRLMILALLVVLYRDSADQKLLMALAYLLT